VKMELQFGHLQMHSVSKGLVRGTSVFNSLISPREGRMWARTIPSYVVHIFSTFVGPSVCLFVEKPTNMGSDFDEHGEEAKTHPFVENLDDASEYIPVWGMSKEGILALPHSIRSHFHEFFGVYENHNGLVVGAGSLKGPGMLPQIRPCRTSRRRRLPQPCNTRLLWYRVGKSLLPFPCCRSNRPWHR